MKIKGDVKMHGKTVEMEMQDQQRHRLMERIQQEQYQIMDVM
jgi:hypothetical protein